MTYTLSFIDDGNVIPGVKFQREYGSIQECIDWAFCEGIDFYLLNISEWEEDEFIAQANLGAVDDDNETESLSKYIVY